MMPSATQNLLHYHDGEAIDLKASQHVVMAGAAAAVVSSSIGSEPDFVVIWCHGPLASLAHGEKVYFAPPHFVSSSGQM